MYSLMFTLLWDVLFEKEFIVVLLAEHTLFTSDTHFYHNEIVSFC